jgi:hypothetical protein
MLNLDALIYKRLALRSDLYWRRRGGSFLGVLIEWGQSA